MIPRYNYDLYFKDFIYCLTKKIDFKTEFLRALSKVIGIPPDRIILYASGRAAIFSILKRIEPGEVIVPAYCCPVIAQAVIEAGHRLCLVDSAPGQLNPSPQHFKDAISAKTRAIIVAHLFGFPVDITELIDICRKRSILLINDTASCLGAKIHGKNLESFGDLAILSFGITGKGVTAGGGGAIVINNLAYKQILQNNHINFVYGLETFCELGIFWILAKSPVYRFFLAFVQKLVKADARIDKNIDLQKKISILGLKLAILQLERYHDTLQKLLLIAERYKLAIKQRNDNFIILPSFPDCVEHPVYSRFPIILSSDMDRASFCFKLLNMGIDYSCPYQDRIEDIFRSKCVNSQQHFVFADILRNKLVNIPLFSHMKESQIKKVETLLKTINKDV